MCRIRCRRVRSLCTMASSSRWTSDSGMSKWCRSTSRFMIWSLYVSSMSRFKLCSSCVRSEEHTSELQSLAYLVCRLLLEKKKKNPRLDPDIATGHHDSLTILLCVTCICPPIIPSLFFFNDTATTEIYTLSLHDALPIFQLTLDQRLRNVKVVQVHQSLHDLVLICLFDVPLQALLELCEIGRAHV